MSRLGLSPILSVMLVTSLGYLPCVNGAAQTVDKEKHSKDYKSELIQLVPCAPPILKDGIYIGAGLGYDAYRIHQHINTVDELGAGVQAAPSLKARGLLGNVIAGYGRYFDWFYIAGEVFANFTGASASYSFLDYHSRFNIHQSYGVGLLPGVAIKKAALVYARVGYVRSYFKAQETIPTMFDLTRTNWGNGLNVGLGVEALLYKNVSVRGEYAYTTYNAFSSQLNTNFSSINNQLTLDLLYHFDYP